ncbi:HAD superfamily (subfamily IIIA) phosphatase, TIGR01668 [Thermaerobacter marianensis DSM 12885]|uniref:HAD superfamily (Subfamily IIIA) phosphatase, TIGR01668 n=1 Tax=Thermaerobacter marianensis (strain ATCC 700841 / DSM 12885 / JCM 10246 / 7p75a) TaxID=644966 RepID=E6SL98_THEM7|nr:YqeG family HAD IIIA-type phosphatase [Thermaerobacter marianensis]ADU51329.1 HAD superfamily (subfamily IIIA) phosphatase, TIGR01668 [Thermaerobacter marianensis DSM 12885]
MQRLWRLLTPRFVVPSIYAIRWDDLRDLGVRGLVLDLDNTLARRDQPLPDETLRRWLDEARQQGFSACILSNNLEHRVQLFAQACGVPAVHAATKPRRRAFLRALQTIGVEPAQAAVIGDQIFTDVLGGNRLGMVTVLVTPLPGKEFVGTRLVRLVERWVLRHLARRGALRS